MLKRLAPFLIAPLAFSTLAAASETTWTAAVTGGVGEVIGRQSDGSYINFTCTSGVGNPERAGQVSISIVSYPVPEVRGRINGITTIEIRVDRVLVTDIGRVTVQNGKLNFEAIILPTPGGARVISRLADAMKRGSDLQIVVGELPAIMAFKLGGVASEIGVAMPCG